MDLMTLLHDGSQLIERDRVEICTVFMKWDYVAQLCPAPFGIGVFMSSQLRRTVGQWRVRCKIGAL
jgi:hypothetical protein